MKRQIIWILAGAILLACTACGGQDHAASSHTMPPPSPGRQESRETKGASGEGGTSIHSSASEDTRENSQNSSAAGSNSSEKEKDIPHNNFQPDSSQSPSASVDVDLTALSSTMVYAEVFNMMMSPDDYIGKTIRITGISIVYSDPETARIHCGVIVQDATACCAQGFNLIMPEGASYPQDYPPSDSEVTVVGKFQVDRTQEDRGIIFLRLENVAFESMGHTP